MDGYGLWRTTPAAPTRLTLLNNSAAGGNKPAVARRIDPLRLVNESLKYRHCTGDPSTAASNLRRKAAKAWSRTRAEASDSNKA